MVNHRSILLKSFVISQPTILHYANYYEKVLLNPSTNHGLKKKSGLGAAMSYTIFVDESGDSGIGNVRSDNGRGATQYMVIAAAALRDEAVSRAEHILREAQKKIGREWRHVTRLRHQDTVFIARKVSQIDVVLFAVISNKKTISESLKEHWGSQEYYNKCVCYLLERVGKYMKEKSDEGGLRHKILFEKRNHDYQKMKNYISTVRHNPIYHESKFLEYVNVDAIEIIEKGEHICLHLADIAAHSVYQCVNKSNNNHNIPEPRYFLELRDRFWCNQSGELLNFGIKPIHSLKDLRLDDEISHIIKNRNNGYTPGGR